MFIKIYKYGLEGLSVSKFGMTDFAYVRPEDVRAVYYSSTICDSEKYYHIELSRHLVALFGSDYYFCKEEDLDKILMGE